MRTFVKHNGLSLFFLTLFLAALAFQSVAGHADFNEDQDRHSDPRISFLRYVTSSEFGTAVMETGSRSTSSSRSSRWSRSGCSSAARPSRSPWERRTAPPEWSAQSSILSRLGPSQGSASGSWEGCGSLVLSLPVAGWSSSRGSSRCS